MKKNRLLENLNKEIGANVPMRRYSLADMISESYKAIYDCEEGSNLKKLAESHLADVKQNPRDIERLSRQLCIIKEMKHLVESNELKDEDLVDKKNYDTVEPNKDRLIQTECNESVDEENIGCQDLPPHIAAKCTAEKAQANMAKRKALKDKTNQSIKEADDPELTDEELEELAKHLETIRKERKDAPKTEMKEDVSPKRRGIKCHIADSQKPKKEMVEGNAPTSAQNGWVHQEHDPAMGEMEDYVKSYDSNLEAYVFPPNESYGNSTIEVNIYDYSEDEDEPIVGTTGEKDNVKSLPAKSGLYKVFSSPQQAMDWCDKYVALLANDIDESKKIKGKRLKESAMPYQSAKHIIDLLIDAQLLKSADFNLAMDLLMEDGSIDESKKSRGKRIKESKSYRGLQNFKKQSEGKAFYKTFKKMNDTLKEGKALTRQESIDLYKAANSALTQMSIELEHNPEFLKTFNESSTLLSTDVNSLRESLARGKAPSKKTMKSLAKFSEALLHEGNDLHVTIKSGKDVVDYFDTTEDEIFDDMKDYEAKDDETVTVSGPGWSASWEDYKNDKQSVNEAEDEDDEDLDDLEDPVEDEVSDEELSADDEYVEDAPEDDDFVGDDEGDIESEEADAFDQEYADARVELHKELEAEHSDDEDPAVQEKIAQDAEEVINLPGITDEQIAEINGEESEEDAPEDSEEEDIPDDEEPTEEPEEDGEITDDELAELKRHLKEMRLAKKGN